MFVFDIKINYICGMKIGYACINMTLGEKNITTNRGMIRKTFDTKGLNYVSELSLHNVRDLIEVIKWNQEHGINFYRMSSDMFPHINDPEVENYTIDEFIPKLCEIGDYCKKYNVRITMHPGQFNQIGTPTKSVLKSTIADLQHHVDILDAMDIDLNGIICIHGGGTYGDKETTIGLYIKNSKVRGRAY